MLGGGPDREQKLASEALFAMKDELRTYIESMDLFGNLRRIPILGRRWLMGDEEVEGLSLIDAETLRAGTGFDRLIDNIVLSSPLAQMPVVGYENHAGRTKLGMGMEPFGKVVSQVGHGNDDISGADGVHYRNCIGTYLHGPLLGKNPEIADYLIKAALQRRLGQDASVSLVALDDSIERNANAYMAQRLGVS